MGLFGAALSSSYRLLSRLMVDMVGMKVDWKVVLLAVGLVVEDFLAVDGLGLESKKVDSIVVVMVEVWPALIRSASDLRLLA